MNLEGTGALPFSRSHSNQPSRHPVYPELRVTGARFVRSGGIVAVNHTHRGPL